MADIFWEGFDKYGVIGQYVVFNNTQLSAYPVMTGEWTFTFPSNNAMQLAIVAGRFSGQAMQLISSNNGATMALTRNLPSSIATAVFGIAFQSNLTGKIGITLFDSATAQLSIIVDTDGKVKVANGDIGGTVVATQSGSGVTASTWHYLEAQITINNTTGAYDIYLDGAHVITASGQNTRQSANNSANAISIRTTTGSGQVFTFDDMYTFDTTGGVNNAVRGDSRVETLFTTADTATIHFTVGSGVLGWWWRGSTNTAAPGANELVLQPVTPNVNCTINSIGILPEATNATVKSKGVIYADSSGAPGSLLSSGTEVVGCTSGTNLTLPLVTPQSLTGGTKYWIGYITDTSVVIAEPYQAGDPLLRQNKSNTYTSGAPNPAGTGFTTSQATLTIWSNTSGQTTNWSEVNSIMPPGDLSYVTDSTVNDEDLYSFASLSSSPTSIAGVKVTSYCERSDAGARTIDLRVHSGGSESGGSNTSITPLGGTYSFVSSYFDTDPNTAAAWTAGGVNALSAGMKVDT